MVDRRSKSAITFVGNQITDVLGRDIVQLITAPEITSFLYNPDRCNKDDFKCHFVGKSDRPCIVKSDNSKACFIMFGRVKESSIVDLHIMGNGPWHNRRLAIFPIAPEISLAFNFFSQLIPGHNMSNFGGYITCSTFPTTPDKGMLFICAFNIPFLILGIGYTREYEGTDAAPPPPPSGPVIINMRADESEDVLLWEVLQKGIESGGLDANSTGS